jgi:hypothetical protein
MLSTINTHASIQALPLDIVVRFASQPDIEKVHAIIETQKKINSSQSSYNANNNSIIKPQQQIFGEIQQALFPCFALTQTCTTYHNQGFKKQIANASKEISYTMFPQGIVPFLLPTAFAFPTIYENFKQEKRISDYWLVFCYHKGPISKDYIMTTLSFSSEGIEKMTKTDEFESLLKSHKLTYSHNPKLKTHTLYDQSKIIVMICEEEKHIRTDSPSINIQTILSPNSKKYQELVPCLIELYLKNCEIPSIINNTINNISYRINKETIISFTLIEFIFHQLSLCVNYLKKLFTKDDLDQAILQDFFSNWFTVIDCLCTLKTINLSLPAVSQKGSVAKKIVAEFKTKGYPLNIFSQETLENLKFCLDDNNNQDWLLEKKPIIDALVDIYLGYFPNQK